MRQSTVSALALAAGLGLTSSYAIAQEEHHHEQARRAELSVQARGGEESSIEFGLGFRDSVGYFRTTAGVLLPLPEDQQVEEGSRYTGLGWQDTNFVFQPGEHYRDTQDRIGWRIGAQGGFHLESEAGPYGGVFHAHMEAGLAVRRVSQWRQSFSDQAVYENNILVSEQRVEGEAQEALTAQVSSSGGLGLAVRGNFPDGDSGIGFAVSAHYHVGSDEAELSFGPGISLGVEKPEWGAELTVVVPLNPLEGGVGGHFAEGSIYAAPRNGPRLYATGAMGLGEHDGETELHLEGLVGVSIPFGGRRKAQEESEQHNEDDDDHHEYGF